MNNYHKAVLLSEIIEYLKPTKGKVFIDATLGGGSHTKALLDQGATVIGVDQDPDAVAFVKSRSDLDHTRLTIVNEGFETAFDALPSDTKVDGILFDLGVSSHQLDTPQRGFSFQSDAPLDMRMSPDLAVTAKDLINGLGKRELYELFTKYGDEKLARPIAEALVRARRLKPIETTGHLARLVERVYGRRHSHLHPATKVFQALRIAINDELNTLTSTLPKAIRLLNPGGRLAIISFHEGEDRIAKNFTKNLEPDSWRILFKKPLTPTPQEIAQNARSRSAKLRVVEKIK